MKDVVIGIVLTVMLVVAFSVYAPMLPKNTACGIYPSQPGEGEVAFCGDGPAFAEVGTEAQKHDELEKLEHSISEDEQESVGDEKNEQIQENERRKSMNEIIVAFWHGVASILIGEACALAVGLIIATTLLRKK